LPRKTPQVVRWTEQQGVYKGTEDFNGRTDIFVTFVGRVLKENSSRNRAGFLATKERMVHKDNKFRPVFFAIYAFFRGYTSGESTLT